MRCVSRPLSSYEPAVGWSRQPRMFMSVLLPEPEAPMMATYSLRPISRFTPRSAWTFSVPMR